MRRSFASLAAALALAITVPAFAGQATDTIASSVTLGSDCSLTVNGMSFGTTSTLLPANVNATSPMQVTCSLGTPYTIAISASTTLGTPVSAPAGYNHVMTGQNGIGVSGRPLDLPYNLTQDAAGAQPWGYTTGTDTVSGTGTGQSTTLTVYGQLIAGSTGYSTGRVNPLVPGNYLDTLTVTLSY